MHRKRSSSHSFAILGVVIVCVVAFSGRDVCADGKHFPEKAYKQSPAIPSQRAILTYKDGIEKLTIESALDGQGREFGWVIPLPSKPTEFEKTSAGLINTFSLFVQPKIIHDLTRDIFTLWRVAVIIIFACLIVTAKNLLERVLLLVLLLVLTMVFIMPPLARRSQRIAMADTPGIKVQDVVQVGSYELAVLEAENAQSLDTWLDNNGFAGLAGEDGQVVSDYIKGGWCFVAAKLLRDGDGYSRPHPLSMSFPSDKAVYPMRLTATVGSNVYLELFVVADKQARCDALILEVSDTYHTQKKTSQRGSSGETVHAGFGGEMYNQSIGHQDAASVLWDGCVVSKLCGTLEPKQMRQDIVVQLEAGKPVQERYYSHRGARETAIVLFLRIWCVLPVGLSLVAYLKKRELSGKGAFLKKVLAPMLLLTLFVGAVTYAVLPKIDVHTSSGSRGMWIKRHMMVSGLSIFTEDHDDFAGNSKDEIAELVAGYFESNDTTNIYTGEPIKQEDSPGDYTIIEDERGVVWRTYSQGGYPDDYVAKPARED
jgi:hypothetical protein